MPPTRNLSSLSLICVCLALIMTGSALGAAITGRHPLQLRIGECRQLCYRQTAEETIISPALCRSWPDCFMCHDYCRVLALAEWSLATSMCADSVFCTRGCRIACDYHRLDNQSDDIGNAVLKDLSD